MLLKQNKIALALAIALMLVGSNLYGLEVDREVAPSITVGGRLMSTLTSLSKTGQKSTKDVEQGSIETPDSSLLLRFDKRLYNSGIAGAVIGFKPVNDQLDAENASSHQLHVFYYDQNFDLKLGRTNLRNTLLEFPTITDDDLADYTRSPNIYSYADNDFYQATGNSAIVDWYLDRKNLALSFWASSRIQTDTLDNRLTNTDINTYGLGLLFEQAEDLTYVSNIRHAGILIDFSTVKSNQFSISTDEQTAFTLITGAEINLNINPKSNWSLAGQLLANSGLKGVQPITKVNLVRSKSNALALALRYTDRPRLLTSAQYAINVAYKDYPYKTATNQTSIAPSAIFILGQGIDLITQAVYTTRSEALASINGYSSELKAQIGLSFSFGASFNDQIGERNSILNLEHGYLN